MNKRTYRPNSTALYINNYIQETFGSNSKHEQINTLMVEPDPGSDLFKKIYTSLNQATLAIIILTTDIEDKNGKIYPSQNVVHELGFMMHKLKARKSGRILVLRQKGVIIPSNIQYYENVEFEKNKECLVLFDIIKLLYNKCPAITLDAVLDIFDNYKKILNDKKNNKIISSDEVLEINDKIEKDF